MLGDSQQPPQLLPAPPELFNNIGFLFYTVYSILNICFLSLPHFVSVLLSVIPFAVAIAFLLPLLLNLFLPVFIGILAEDVDPTIGRFRNMIQSSLVPVKRPRLDSDPPLAPIPSSPTSPNKFTQPLRSGSSSSTQLYPDFPLSSPTTPTGSLGFTSSFLSRTITAGLCLIFETIAFSISILFSFSSPS